MRYLIFAVIVAFLFSPAVVRADTKKLLDDLEQRVSDLEQQTLVGNIKVHDVNGQCFGVLVSYKGAKVVFNPSLEAFIEFEDVDIPEVGLVTSAEDLVYEDYNCEGQAYGGRQYLFLQKHGQGIDALWSIAGPLSDKVNSTGECINLSTPPDPGQIYRRPKTIIIDKSDLPFDPDLIVGPLQFK